MFSDKLRVFAGVAITAIILVIGYQISFSNPAPTPAVIAPVLSHTPEPAYISVGDSTADGTPVAPAPVYTGSSSTTQVESTSAAVPAQTTATTSLVQTESPSTAPAVTANTPATPSVPVAQSVPAQTPFEVDCQLQSGSMIDYYKNQLGKYADYVMLSVNKLSSDQCDAVIGTPLIGSNREVVDARRFTFNKDGITSMGDRMSGISAVPPLVYVPRKQATITAPPIPSHTEIGKYFDVYPGKQWNTTSQASAGYSSLDYCQQQCFTDPTCVGINYNPNVGCSLVSSSADILLDDSDPYNPSTFYYRVPAFRGIAPAPAPSNIAAYTTFPGIIDQLGISGAVMTQHPADCAAICDANPNCRGFSYIGNTCLPKTNTRIDFTNKSGGTLYVKPTVSTSPLPAGDTTDYLGRFTNFVDSAIQSSNKPYDGVFTAKECAARCLSDTTCLGFNRTVFGTCQPITIQSTPNKYPNVGVISYYSRNPLPTTTPTVSTTTSTVSPTTTTPTVSTTTSTVSPTTTTSTVSPTTTTSTVSPTTTTTSSIPTSTNIVTSIVQSAPLIQSVVSSTTNAIAGFTHYASRYYNSSDGTSQTGVSREQCGANCANNYRCTGFNYWLTPQQCVQFFLDDPSMYKPMVSHADASFYTKNNADTKPLLKYKQYTGRYFNSSNGISQAGISPEQCAANCNQNTRCTGFNYWKTPQQCVQLYNFDGHPLTSHIDSDFYEKL